MVTTNKTPFVATNTEVPSSIEEAASTNEKQPQTIETTTHVITEKPSSDSMASATIVATSSSNEKSGLRPSTDSVPGASRPSDLASPDSVHHGSPFETDIEAMITHTSNGGSNAMAKNSSRRSLPCKGLGGDAGVWPGQSHWKKKAKEQKMQRSCTCLSRLSKRNRMIAKILVGVLVIGIAIGVGVGISKPLGAPIWTSHNTSTS